MGRVFSKHCLIRKTPSLWTAFLHIFVGYSLNPEIINQIPIRSTAKGIIIAIDDNSTMTSLNPRLVNDQLCLPSPIQLTNPQITKVQSHNTDDINKLRPTNNFFIIIPPLSIGMRKCISFTCYNNIFCVVFFEKPFFIISVNFISHLYI